MDLAGDLTGQFIFCKAIRQWLFSVEKCLIYLELFVISSTVCVLNVYSQQNGKLDVDCRIMHAKFDQTAVWAHNLGFMTRTFHTPEMLYATKQTTCCSIMSSCSNCKSVLLTAQLLGWPVVLIFINCIKITVPNDTLISNALSPVQYIRGGQYNHNTMTVLLYNCHLAECTPFLLYGPGWSFIFCKAIRQCLLSVHKCLISLEYVVVSRQCVF